MLPVCAGVCICTNIQMILFRYKNALMYVNEHLGMCLDLYMACMVVSVIVDLPTDACLGVYGLTMWIRVSSQSLKEVQQQISLSSSHIPSNLSPGLSNGNSYRDPTLDFYWLQKAQN